MAARLCAISVDLDEIPNYAKIHGLEADTGLHRTAVYDLAMDRLVGWAKAEGVPLTLFAVGSDLRRSEAVASLRAARAAGFEIANHSLDHLYDLTERSPDAIRDQVEGGIRAIAEAVGRAPVGFRAPGYVMTDEVFAVLNELGVGYDSSVFPCPSYYAAKAAAMGLLRAKGRRSHSILDRPEVLAAPVGPYRVGRPYWREGTGILELPIQVTRGLRLPFIGTSITLAGPIGARVLAKMCIGAPLVNLELHGIDALDAEDGLRPLLAHQPDVRTPTQQKFASLSAAVGEIRRAGYSFVTLEEAATTFS